MKLENEKLDERENQQLNIGAVMLRNFMQTSSNIVNVEGGKTAYVQGYFEFKSYFKKSRSTYYRWAKRLAEIDNNFWHDKNCSTLLFYYAT
jgi:hypothetical protein